MFRISRLGKEILHCEGGEALKQDAQRSCGWPVPRSVQVGEVVE